MTGLVYSQSDGPALDIVSVKGWPDNYITMFFFLQFNLTNYS